MPILWRYLMSHFTRIALTCTLAFIAILLTMRLDEIAHFTSMGAPLKLVLLFTAYQIPYILPLALPLSCLIASTILIQRLSHTHELTALRASGFSLRDIMAPVMLVAAFAALLNFWVISEVATQSHLKTNFLKNELRSINPLLLLNNKQLMRIKGFYFEALGPSKNGELATDVILAMPNKHQNRINLLIAKQLKATSKQLIGENITLLSSIEKEAPEFDDLLLENIQKTESQVQDFSHFLQRKVWVINNDYLKLPLLLVRSNEQRVAWEEALQNKQEPSKIKQLKYQYYRSHSEIIKRISIALAVITFTLMGLTFGVSISRHRSIKGLFWVILLALIYLVAFFAAKGVEQNRNLAITLYMAPHLLIIGSSLVMVKRISRGIE